MNSWNSGCRQMTSTAPYSTMLHVGWWHFLSRVSKGVFPPWKVVARDHSHSSQDLCRCSTPTLYQTLHYIHDIAVSISIFNCFYSYNYSIFSVKSEFSKTSLSSTVTMLQVVHSPNISLLREYYSMLWLYTKASNTTFGLKHTSCLTNFRAD